MLTSKGRMNILFQTLMIIATYINIMKGQETYTCDDPSGCNWICKNGGRCNGYTFICPSTTAGCTFECRSCVNVRIFSSAPKLNINCVERTGCINMEITAETTNTNIEIQCGSSLCSGIALNCPSETAENCQCIDNGQNICNSQVNGIWGTSTTNPSITTTTTSTSTSTSSSTTTTTTTSNIASSNSITTSSSLPRDVTTTPPPITPSTATTKQTTTPSHTGTTTASKTSTITSPLLTDTTTTTTASTFSASSINTASTSTSSISTSTSTPTTLHPADNFIVEVTEKVSSEKPDGIKTINVTRIVHIYDANVEEQSRSSSLDNIALIGVLILGALFCCTICIVLPLFIVYYQKARNTNSKLEGIPVRKLRVAAFSGEFDIAASIPPNSPQSPGTTNIEDDGYEDEEDEDIMNDIEINIDRYQNKNTGIAFGENARQKTESGGYGTDTSCLYGHGGNNGYAEGDIVTGPTKGGIVLSPSIIHGMTKGVSGIDDDELDLKELEEPEVNEQSITETMEVMAFAITNAALPLSPLNSNKSDIEVDAREYHVDLTDLTIAMNKIDEMGEEEEEEDDGDLNNNNKDIEDIEEDGDIIKNVDVTKYIHIGVKTPDSDNMEAVIQELQIAMPPTLDNEEEFEQDVMIKKTEDYNYVD